MRQRFGIRVPRERLNDKQVDFSKINILQKITQYYYAPENDARMCQENYRMLISVATARKSS